MESPRYHVAMRVRVAVATFSLLLLFVLGWFALFTVPGQNLDNLGMEALVQRATRVPTQLSLLTHLVSVPALVLVAVVVLGVAVVRKRVALGLRALLVVAGGNLTVQLVKLILWRPDLEVSLELENSFPSGHTAFAASVSAALVIVVPRAARAYAAVFGTVWTSCMSLVVIAQGWHRPADTIGAILAVAAWAVLLAPIETGRRSRRWRVGTAVSTILFALGMVAGAVAVISVRGILDVPLSYAEISQTVGTGIPSGIFFALASALIPTGLQAMSMAILDRFSLRTGGPKSPQTTAV